ncbi:hypothetical protein [Streptomyces sp. t99]|uniref:hypothetical protein n=1 Tax=Streptomyces sp. t99 TaxID=1828172 RepID=UPI000BFE274C|nr:hypothetical protein [Streptomyces sp. t99]
MTAQDLPSLVPNARGGDEKTTLETDFAALLPDDEPQHERVLVADLDSQPSVEGFAAPYRPVIVDLPGSLH